MKLLVENISVQRIASRDIWRVPLQEQLILDYLYK